MLNNARPSPASTQCKVSRVLWMRKQLSVAEMWVVAFPKPLKIPFQFSPRKTQVICIGKVKTQANVQRFSDRTCWLKKYKCSMCHPHIFKTKNKVYAHFTLVNINILRWLFLCDNKSLSKFCCVRNKVKMLILHLNKKWKCPSFGYPSTFTSLNSQLSFIRF